MTAAEAKQEFEKLAKEHGLSPEASAAVLQAFENQKFADAVANGYARHSEYSSALDKARKYEDWYEKQAKPLLDWSQGASAALQAYEAKFGKLDDTSPGGDKNAAAQAAGITREELEKVLKAREDAQGAAMNNAVVQYERIMGDIRTEHLLKFKERLDVQGLNKFMADNKINDLERGYELFVKPRVQKLADEETEARIKQRVEEGIRDFASRHKIPTTPRPEPTTPFKDMESIRHSKDYDKDAQDSAARDEFMKAWSESAPSSAAQ